MAITALPTHPPPEAMPLHRLTSPSPGPSPSSASTFAHLHRSFAPICTFALHVPPPATRGCHQPPEMFSYPYPNPYPLTHLCTFARGFAAFAPLHLSAPSALPQPYPPRLRGAAWHYAARRRRLRCSGCGDAKRGSPRSNRLRVASELRPRRTSRRASRH